jgi:hypothetical protein
MSDVQRQDVTNGVWLCRDCAWLVDSDASQYPVELLQQWKRTHEASVLRRTGDAPGREVNVRGGGIGSIITNTGGGTAVEVNHVGKGPAERINVEGTGTGEIITNIGPGTAKRVTNTGGGPASVSEVNVTEPVQVAFALSSTLAFMSCPVCGHTFKASKVVQGFAGKAEPQADVRCPKCHNTMRL